MEGKAGSKEGQEKSFEYFLWFLEGEIRKGNVDENIAEAIAKNSDKIAYHAFKRRNLAAYDLLEALAKNHPDLFKKYFSDHVAKNSDKIAYHAFEEGNPAAYDLLEALARNHPNLFIAHLSGHIAYYAFEERDRYAYRLLEALARKK